MKELAAYKFYIVNLTRASDPFVYKKGFLTTDQAREARDAYISSDQVTEVWMGLRCNLEAIPQRRARFPLHSPYLNRHPELKVKTNLAIKRSRIKGQGISTHLFKMQWTPSPKGAKARAKARLKDRDRIRNIILKSENDQ